MSESQAVCWTRMCREAVRQMTEFRVTDQGELDLGLDAVAPAAAGLARRRRSVEDDKLTSLVVLCNLLHDVLSSLIQRVPA